MQAEKCPKCRSLTPADGYVERESGNREALYRCKNLRCEHMFSRSDSARLTENTERYSSQHGDTIETDC